MKFISITKNRVIYTIGICLTNIALHRTYCDEINFKNEQLRDILSGKQSRCTAKINSKKDRFKQCIFANNLLENISSDDKDLLEDNSSEDNLSENYSSEDNLSENYSSEDNPSKDNQSGNDLSEDNPYLTLYYDLYCY